MVLPWMFRRHYYFVGEWQIDVGVALASALLHYYHYLGGEEMVPTTAAIGTIATDVVFVAMGCCRYRERTKVPTIIMMTIRTMVDAETKLNDMTFMILSLLRRRRISCHGYGW